MRCKACNEPLGPRESTRKYASHDEYLELCNECTKDSGIAYVDSQVKDRYDDEKD